MSLTLIGGAKIPIIGLGTWLANNEEQLEIALDVALEAGYRHIDTASMYQNEQIIGNVLNRWFKSGKLKREDVFVTTKLSTLDAHPNLVESALRLSLEKLQLNYVDLYLIHFPIYQKKGTSGTNEAQPTDHIAIWKKMEEQVDAKRTKAIGVSNFNIPQIERILQNSRIKPANNQTEIHIYNQEKRLVEYCHKNNITVVSYSSLGSPGFLKYHPVESKDPPALQNPVAIKIAQKHNKSVGQVLLRYLTQRDIIVIPKSVTPTRVKENLNILDFKLDEEDIRALAELDRGEEGRLLQRNGLRSHPEYPFGK